MPTTARGTDRPVCLLCNESVAVAKEYNVKRHFTTKHSSFSAQYQEGSVERQRKIDRLVTSFEQSQRAIGGFCTEQERAFIASLRVAWILTRKKRPFTESETIKDCMLAVVDEMIVDQKMKDHVSSSIKKVPLSDTSALRRVDLLAKDVFDKLLENIQKTELMSIAIDESTDTTDVAQMCVYVRFYDGVRFREELLGLIPLEGHTTGEVLFQNVVAFFSEHKLDLQKVCLLVTDGAPAMLGRVQGLTARLSAVAPQMQFLHCIIHESVLCAKLSGELKNTMDKVTSIVNFIRSTSSLQHRLFRLLLDETSAEHADLLAHCDVRWLSKGNVLDRFCDLRGEIISFLRTCKHKRAAHFLEHMLDEQFMTQVHFLCDIFGHLNSLNSELQGREKCIADLVERLCAFKTKLNVFVSDLTTNKLMHFTHLRTFLTSTPGAKVMPTMIEFMTKLTENFSDRFQGFSLPMEVMQFTRDPFSISHDSNFIAKVKELMPNIDESALQLEMIDIQSSLALKLHLQSEGPINFWCNHISQAKYPTIKKVSVLILTMFGSTYTCESSFSHMNAIKTKARCCLSNEKLSQCLRIALTTYEPDYVKMAKANRCHFSH